MTAVKVFLADGSSYWTSVNPASSDVEIRTYFVGADLNMGCEHDDVKRCVDVEIER
jgi:hypothetical protein